MLNTVSPFAGQPPLELSRDATAVLQREIQDMGSTLGTLFALVGGTVPVSAELVHSSLHLLESRLAKLSTTFGVPIDTAAEKERRHLELRTANLRIRELEKQRGQSVSAQDTTMAVRALCERFTAWWAKDGLGYVSEVRLSAYGALEATLSCRASSMVFSMSDTPDSDETDLAQWHNRLRERGFEFYQEPGDDDLVLIDSDKNHALLNELIIGSMPSSIIRKTTCNRSRTGIYLMQDMEILVRQLSDIEQLPVPVKLSV